MWEFGIYNKETKEDNIIFGYDFLDACKRCNVNPDEWIIKYREYID